MSLLLLGCLGEPANTSPLEAPLGPQISTNDSTACAASNGIGECWGSLYNTIARGLVDPAARVVTFHYAMLVLSDGVLTTYQSQVGLSDLGPPGNIADVEAGAGCACTLSVVGAPRCIDNDRYPMEGTPTFPLSEVDADEYAACGIDPDGEALCWGDRGSMVLPDPPPGPLHGITTGRFHACALDADDLPLCWGDLNLYFGGDYWWEDPPETPFVKVDAGWGVACGLDADGEVTCWGHGTPGYEDFEKALKAPPPGPWVDFALSGVIACAIDADGKVACWGYSESGIEDVPEDLER